MRIFISGATGYMGTALIPRLLARGHEVRALCRPGSESKLPKGCSVLIGDALKADSFSAGIAGMEACVHLVGTAKPAPWKEEQFRAVDLPSLKASVVASVQNNVKHFVYVSVARPAPVMRAYQAVRGECETEVANSSLPATVVRPWYVLGPGHRWPYALLPLYGIAGMFPPTREGASRLGLVTLEQMIRCLLWSVENPSTGMRFIEVPEIRRLGGAEPAPLLRAANPLP